MLSKKFLNSMDLAPKLGHDVLMTTTHEPGWDALAYATQKRRERLKLTQRDIADKRGPSVATLSKIESAKGTPYSKRTLSSLDEALGWEKGTANGIVTGSIPGAWLNSFSDDVDNVIASTSHITTDSFSQAEIERIRAVKHFPGEESASVPSEMIDTEATLARLRRARDELTAAIESIQAAAHIARLDKLQQQADNAPLSEIMGLAALEEETPEQGDADQGSQDPDDY